MARRRQVPFWPAFVVIVLSLGLAAWVSVRHARSTAEQTARIAGLETENRELHARSEDLAREVESLSVPAVAAEPLRTEDHHPERDKDTARHLEQAQMIIQLREKLTAANTSIDHLHLRVQELEAGLERASEENKRLAASEAEFREKYGVGARILEAMQTELKGKDSRLVHLEAMNSRLREESRASSARVAQVPGLLRELEEINRRRETYLSNILRRYKDMTDQYRALSGRLDSAQDSPLAGGSEMARIQECVSMAEEDLRQLSNLNSQAVRIQQKLSRQ